MANQPTSLEAAYLLTHQCFKEVIKKLSSEAMILLKLTLKLRSKIQKFWRRIVGIVLNNVSPLNIFPSMLFPARFCQKRRVAFG